MGRFIHPHRMLFLGIGRCQSLQFSPKDKLEISCTYAGIFSRIRIILSQYQQSSVYISLPWLSYIQQYHTSLYRIRLARVNNRYDHPITQREDKKSLYTATSNSDPYLILSCRNSNQVFYDVVFLRRFPAHFARFPLLRADRNAFNIHP